MVNYMAIIHHISPVFLYYRTIDNNNYSAIVYV